MPGPREKSSATVVASFDAEAEWCVFELQFNVGLRTRKKPVKLQANRVFSTPRCPILWASIRASFESEAAAEEHVKTELSKEGGMIHSPTAELLSKLERNHGYRAK